MDIVIPVIKHDLFNHVELRYTLRSIEKYLTGFADVWIIGHAPTWCKGVYHLDFPWYGPERPNFNIRDKLLHAANEERISDYFLYFNDDHILTKPADAKNYPDYYDGYLGDRVYKENQTPYNEIVENTHKMLRWRPSALYYDVHTPIAINKNDFLSIMASMAWHPPGYIIKSIYRNQVVHRPPRHKNEKVKDLKVIRPIDNPNKWHQLMTEVPVISTDAGAINACFRQVMEEVFPQKSNFEK
jgi:hypothetical protein